MYSSRIIAFSFTLTLCACGDEAPAPLGPLPDPLTYEVDADGPFGIGYRTIDVSYTSPAGERDLLVHIWFPSEDPSGENPTYRNLFPDDESFIDAPVARPAYDGAFPVLVHSHGHMGFAGNSADVMRHFASHGWIAIAPDHTDNVLGMAIEPRPFRHYFERPLDIGATLDALEGLPAGDALAGLADMTRVAMSGHSFGVYTTWASGGATYDEASIQGACDMGEISDCTPEEVAVFAEQDLSEPRAKVIIPMAGGARDSFFGPTGYDSIGVPVLLMTGSEDDVGAASLFDSVTGIDMSWVDVAGGCHQLFGLGGCELISDEDGFPIVNAYALAFARRYALGDETVSDIVDGSVTVSDAALFQSK